MKESVAMVAVDALVAGLAIEDEEAVERVTTPVHVRTVVTVFIVVRRKDKITVTVSGGKVCEFTILIACLQIDRKHGYCEHQFFELFKK